MAVRRVSPRVHIPALRAGAQTRVVAAPCRLRPRTGGRGATGGLLWAADAQPEGTGGTQDNPWDTCCPLLGHSGTSLFRANDINQYRIFVLSWPGVNVIKLRVPIKQGENVASINDRVYHSYYFPMILCLAGCPLMVRRGDQWESFDRRSCNGSGGSQPAQCTLDIWGHQFQLMDIWGHRLLLVHI